MEDFYDPDNSYSSVITNKKPDLKTGLASCAAALSFIAAACSASLGYYWIAGVLLADAAALVLLAYEGWWE